MIAVIDIGSNSVRMLIKGNGFEEKEVITTRLGEGLQKTGSLNNDAVLRTVNAVKGLADKARLKGARNIYAYATEAVRAAANGREFCADVFDASGIDVRILSGKEEAACSFYGALSGLPVRDEESNNKLYGVIDIGGASTELIVGNNSGIVFSHSAPYGIVRIKDYASENSERIAEFLSGINKEFRNIPIFDELIGIGGTLTNIAAIKLKLKDYDRNIVHGTIINIDEIEAARREIYSTPMNERGKIIGLSPARRDTIIGGIGIAEAMLKLTGKDRITVSENDNLEGFIILKENGLIKI